MSWEDDQRFEVAWWGHCQNTYGEETKQFEYAKHMKLPVEQHSIDLQGRSIVDIGGGPVSLLLKCRNFVGAVVDPADYPSWTGGRYARAGIKVHKIPGELFIPMNRCDEVWIYNVLQHVKDPEKIIRNARNAAPVLRIFEWINIPPHQGHPHMLTKKDLDKWIGGKGDTGVSSGEHGCSGEFYSGYFQSTEELFG